VAEGSGSRRSRRPSRTRASIHPVERVRIFRAAGCGRTCSSAHNGGPGQDVVVLRASPRRWPGMVSEADPRTPSRYLRSVATRRAIASSASSMIPSGGPSTRRGTGPLEKGGCVERFLTRWRRTGNGSCGSPGSPEPGPPRSARGTYFPCRRAHRSLRWLPAPRRSGARGRNAATSGRPLQKHPEAAFMYARCCTRTSWSARCAATGPGRGGKPRALGRGRPTTRTVRLQGRYPHEPPQEGRVLPRLIRG